MGECRGATGKMLPPTPFFHFIRRLFRPDFDLGAQTAGGQHHEKVLFFWHMRFSDLCIKKSN
jgi:hypothetical protein